LNADPNYGTSWFYFRDRPISTPGAIIDSAHQVLTHELVLTEPVYTRTMVHYIASVIQAACSSGRSGSSSGGDGGGGTGGSFDFPSWLQDWGSVHPGPEALCSAPLQSVDGLLTLSSQDFITGTVQLSRVMCTTGRGAPAEERREMLYGSDQITP
jgi:hypothetical protein